MADIDIEDECKTFFDECDYNFERILEDIEEMNSHMEVYFKIIYF